jgi:hypothetical protein
MDETTSTKGTPDVKPATAPPVCHHTWTTEAPYKTRCTVYGFVVPITTEEVSTDATPQSG